MARSVFSADRVILIRDQIITKVGGNVLGNLPSSGAVMRHEVTPRRLDGS
jgi:hypothetical protein